LLYHFSNVKWGLKILLHFKSIWLNKQLNHSKKSIYDTLKSKWKKCCQIGYDLEQKIWLSETKWKELFNITVKVRKKVKRKT
jgi:hypothetical protein